ncbi:MAG: DUF2490 domain-containing protein [Hyphomonas sp.]
MIFLQFPAHAQTTDQQIWTSVLVSGPVSDDSRLLVWFDGHARFSDDMGGLGVSILRPGLGWKMNDNLSLWGGYARVTSDSGRGDLEEYRFWQQATYSLPGMFAGKSSGRTRLEQRWREAGDDTGWRLRQSLRWTKTLEETPISLVLWNETFVAFNEADWGQADGYDQNRAFAGLGFRLTDRSQLELGYLHNHIRRSGPDASNHNLAVSLSVRP